MVIRDRRGFTLVEAIIALTLSSVLVVLVSTVFLVQNRYYALQLERTAAQDNARMVTEMVASEIRSVMQGGVVEADNKRLVVRSPIVLGVVCGHGSGNRTYVQMSGGAADIDTDDVTGVALRDTLTGDWDYRDAAWSRTYQGTTGAAAECATNGADTVGVYDEFLRFRRFNNFFGSQPPLGSVVMFYREVEYEFDTSEMDPASTALFRASNGGDLLEFATGMDPDAQFKYRTGGSTYANSVSGGSVANIDAIRLEAQSRRKPQTGGVDDVTFGWGVNVFLRNGG